MKRCQGCFPGTALARPKLKQRLACAKSDIPRHRQACRGFCCPHPSPQPARFASLVALWPPTERTLLGSVLAPLRNVQRSVHRTSLRELRKRASTWSPSARVRMVTLTGMVAFAQPVQRCASSVAQRAKCLCMRRFDSDPRLQFLLAA